MAQLADALVLDTKDVSSSLTESTMTIIDRDRRNEYHREYYHRNKRIAQERVRSRLLELKEWFRELKRDFSCELCGEDDFRTLDFHHTNPEGKEFSVSTMVHDGYSRKRIEEEIRKCLVLCANCHRKLEYPNWQREQI